MDEENPEEEGYGWDEEHEGQEDEDWPEQNEEGYGYGQEGGNEPETIPPETEADEPGSIPQLVKAMWSEFQTLYQEAKRGRETTERPPALKEVVVGKLATTDSGRVLLDGVASHNVYYSAEVPKGAIEREMYLAHGSKTGSS